MRFIANHVMISSLSLRRDQMRRDNRFQTRKLHEVADICHFESKIPPGGKERGPQGALQRGAPGEIPRFRPGSWASRAVRCQVACRLRPASPILSAARPRGPRPAAAPPWPPIRLDRLCLVQGHPTIRALQTRATRNSAKQILLLLRLAFCAKELTACT